ncbi:alpha/beta hydrolase family protein [Streptomyces sp. Je 1-4]|uniref:alpha/beta hydrolase family protein n=1 Tax=Streptomyces TaxID=1883 RepID=UPI0021D91EC5|nr:MULTISPECIES: alpha/beta hydrolase family protein [unclassified Streptomyces]UYB42634.1 alpha/beta hydrolase family protein [Streptomyces sp. Je 1-4]UZQ38952.1 alpha/beta hydrolase family protein [Streptomyces sp. Je 1-4] [Streptomyces sp. Je 1-4 4N24]UZQ46369.1 alpha/beta hydrolase family protein [Streptomyces sp. Je 1-4] [Streptomyces sp. Je 1-4 4N24_ara]
MNSFSGLGPSSGFLQSTSWRAALALSVVFVMLAITGWTAVRGTKEDANPLATARTSWQHATFLGRPLPDPQGPPAALRAFFATLSRAEKQQLADRYPLVVGNLGGAPVKLRYRANRTAIDDARRIEKRRMNDHRLTPVGRQEAGRLMHRLESMMSPGRQILAFDPADGGRAAEVFGNLPAAHRVSVVVPGVDINLSTFERTARANTAPVGMARALYGAEREARPSARTAVIAWADYTTPSGVGVEAATGQLAAAGAVRLRALVDSLPSSDAVSLFCHSYGSVVCGVAARDLPSNVEDIAVAGSPGMRAENRSRLGTQARVWAMRDSDDWIQDIPNLEVGGLGHGADPVDPAFGSRILSADGAVGHAGYFAPGTRSLRNFALVGVGAADTVDCASDDPQCTTGLV